jgi:tetratricopeptide (TPR) repeat protein
MKLLIPTKIINKILFLFCFVFALNLNAKQEVFFSDGSSLEANANKIKRTQIRLKMQYVYNQGVDALKNKNFDKAILFFERTKILINAPSLLNLGVAYYNLKQNDKAMEYFEQVLKIKDLENKDYFAYLSCNYYLFLINADKQYANNAFTSFYKRKITTPQIKRLILDLHILLKQYEKSIVLLHNLNEGDNFKLGILYAKTKNFDKAQKHLLKAYNDELIQSVKNDILWVKIYIDLKSNNLRYLKEDLHSLLKRKKNFKSHIKMPLEIFFNKNMKTSDDNLYDLINLKLATKIDFIYYFAPFLFFDDEKIAHTLAPKFASQINNNQSRDTFIYNQKLLKILKQDHIKRVQTLQEDIDKKTDTYSYEYYNLALSYAQIKDYKSAYDNFVKAYRLNRGNNLYIAMVLMTLQKVDIVQDKEEEIAMLKRLISEKGSYKYLAQKIYNIHNNNYFDLSNAYISNIHKNSLFYRALNFLSNYNIKDKKTFKFFKDEDLKDPLVSMFFMIKNTDNLNKYNYISKVQNALPTQNNEYYLKSAWVVNDFYIKLLKTFGLFEVSNFELYKNSEPSHLKTKAYVYLFSNKAQVARSLLNLLQKKYNLKDIDTHYYLACAMLDMGDTTNAWSVFWNMEYIYKNKDAKFLNGLRLLSDLKIDTAITKFESQYTGTMVDFSLKNYETLLQIL